MLSFGSATELAEMGKAGLQFVEQFEMQRVLANFEKELLKVAAEHASDSPEPEESSPGR